MRIVPLVVFYIAIYVARIANGGETTRTTSGNGVKHILRQKNEAIRDEVLIDDKVTRETNKRRGQSLINRFDGLSRNHKIRNGKLERIKQNLRRRKKRAKDSNIARYRNVFENNDVDEDVDKKEEDTLSTKTRGLPIWQVSDPTEKIKTEMINRTMFKIPSSRNLNSYRSSDKAISLIASDRRSNPYELLFDANVPDKNLVFSKFQNSKSVRSPVFEKLINKVPFSAYPKIPVDMDSSNSRPSQRFEWRQNGYRKGFSDSRNIKQDSPKDHLADSNERFLLVPVSKDLYVLKNIKDNSETSIGGTIIPNRYKLLGRNKIEKNTTSAIISFKAHMHHDMKNVGRVYLHHRDSNNHRLSDYDTNYLHTNLDSRIFEENMEKFTTLLYSNFLYPGIGFQTRPNLNDTIPEILDQQVTLSVPDYKYISSVDAEVIPYNSSIFSSTSPSFDISNYDVFSYSKENDRLTSYSNTDHFFLNNAENILNNLDTNKDDIESGISISSECSDKKSTYSNDFNYNDKFIDETLFNNYTTIKLDSFLNVEDYTTSALLLSVTDDEWSLKKKQSNVGNPRALLKAIEPLSSELKKLLTAVKLVNQSISNVQNRLCNKKNVVRSARIERESKERKTTNIAELINSKDNFDLFIESSNNQSLGKKHIKIKEKNIIDRTRNDVKLKRKFNNYFLNKLTTPLHKRESSIRNDHRNFLEKRKLNESISSSRHNTLSKFPNMSAVKDSRINFLLNRKRDLTTRYNGTSKLSSDKEKKYSPMDPQSYSLKEATAYLDILRLFNITKKPYVELTDIVTESLISTTEFFVTTVTILPYPIERSMTTVLETTTKKKIDYEVVEAISLTQLSVTLSAFTITMPTTPPQLYTTGLPIFDEILEIENTTLTVAIFTEVTETSTVKLTTESAMLLTSFLEGIANITLRITVPAATSTTLIEEASTTEEEIVKSTLTTEVTQSFPFETSTSLYIISTVPSFTTAETAESTIQITTLAIPILTSLIITKKPRITTPIEEAISVTERMITVISPTIMMTKSTAILGENTTLYRAITSASTAKITEVTSLVAEEIKTTSIESTTTTEYMHITTLSTTQFVPPAQVTKGTTETSITSIAITVVRYTITAITSSPTISERTETIVSTSTEIAITTLTPEGESPVTQIEKTITTEEITTEIPTIIETPTTTKIPIISKTSMLNETSTSSTTPTTIEVSSTKITETLLTTIETTITKTSSGISTITNTLPLRTIIKPSTTTEISTLIESSITTKIQTIIKTSIITETIESTSISSVISVTTTAVKTIPTTLLTLMTTKRSATTSVKTTVPSTTLLKLTTTTPLSLVTNTTLSETPCTIFTTLLTEEIETTTSSITSTISTIKTLLTTLPTLITTTTFLNTSVAINKTLFTTIFTTFKTATTETATLPMIPVITSPFEATLTPSIVSTNTTLSEITFNTSLTEMTEESTSTTISLTEVISTTSLVELTTEERIATWITTEETTIIEATTLMTYIPLSTTMFSIEITTETTLFAIETITASSEEISFTTITEESSLIKEITNVTFTTVEISTPMKITLTFTEKSTIPVIETSVANTSLTLTIAMTTVSFLREATEKTSMITTPVTLLPITEKPEQIAILKTETFTPLSEFTLSILITSETSATMPEVISVLSETISEEEEFTTILTSPSYILESSILFTERTIQPTISTLAAITTEMPEAETEYYVAKEPFYEKEYEEYEECDTEIPTDNWYYYEEYKTTMKRKTTVTSSTAKYTKLPKETATSPPFDKGTTSSYETKTSEFTMYFTTSTSTHTIILPIPITKIPYTYTEEEFALTSALKTSTETIIENITTTEVGAMFITSITSKEEESMTMALTFGSTEEYTLLPSTVFEIITKPLEYLTIPAKYTEATSKFLTQIYSVTAPKFITKPEEISVIELEETSTSTEISTETEFTSVVKLTSFFVSSTLTTLLEREAIGVTFLEMETATEIASEVITLATKLITKEEITSYTTIVPETEFVTMRRTTIGREEQRKQLLQLLDDLKQREREVTEREERLKEKEQQWEKKKHEEMMQREKEKTKNITIVSGTTASYITVTVAPTTEIKITSLLLDTLSLTEIITTSTETTPLYTTEEGIFATNVTESTEETTKESTFPTYMVEVTEETVIFYTTEESTSVTYKETEATEEMYITKEMYLTKETEEMYITNYTTLTSYVVDLYNISLVSIETTTEEMYITSYETAYLSESLFTSPTMVFTSPITLAIEEFTILPTATFNISSYEMGATSIATPTRITKERYTTSYVTFCSVFPFTSSTMTLTGLITPAIDITTSSISVTTPISYTTEKTEDIYSESSVTSPFIKTTTALTISTIKKIEYDEEIESMKEKLRKMERELEKREKMLLEREKRLEKDMIEFELYMKTKLEEEEMRTLIALSEKPIVSTSLSTPIPPIENTAIKTQVVTEIKKVTEKIENRTTTKMVTSRYETTKDTEEEKRTRYIPEKITTQKMEEEIVTRRICLNVLENTTIPFVVKKVCLPHFPEKNRGQKSVGHLNRKLLSFKNTREIRESKFRNFPSNFRYKRRGTIETTRKIDNLQLSHHEWLNNGITKPMRHFKGFTRIYGKKEKSLKKISTTINTQEDSTHNFRGKTLLYEQHILDSYEHVFPKTFTLDNKKYRKRNAFIEHNLISARRNNFSNDNDKCIEKINVLPAEKNTANVSNQKATSVITEEEKLDEKEDEYYTVNVLHLRYNKDRETHEVISAKPNEELTMIISESNDDVTKFEEDGKIAAPYYEEKSDLQEGDDLQEKEKLEKDDSFEDYMNYEECTTSIPIRDKFLYGENKSKIENEAKLLDQIWPTEKSTIYHLGGTRFWELEVTEPSVVFSITTEESKAIDVSVTRTTCLYVVLKNEINTDAKAKRNIHYNKRNVYNNKTRKYNISMEKRKIGLKNITRKNTQNLRELNRYSNEDLIIAKTRKLCSVNENESKHQIIKSKDNINIRDKIRKKQSAKSQNINSYSPKSCTDSCIINKKNLGKTITRTTTNHYSQAKSSDNKKNDKKVTNNDIIADHKNQSMFVSRERKKHDYLNCICDIVNVIENIKSILNRISFSLDEIKELNCSVYKETQDKIVISMDSDAEEAKEFPQPHYNIESLKGQKYINLEELEDDFKSDLELGNDHDIVSLPGLNLNLPCNQDGDGITWLSSISRPSYVWKRTDGIAIFGFVTENGDLELRNVNAKDTGNYTCIATYIGPETEEPVETTYEVCLQVVTLPRYIIHGENRYYTRSCDERDLDILVTYLPVKLNDIICEADICNVYTLTPSCSRSQITVNILLLPSHIVKLMTIDPKRCNVFCLKAIQDKLSLILSKNLQILLGKTIIFRLPHYEQRLVPIAEKSTFARWKRGRTNAFAGKTSNIGLFSSCPAGYGLHGTHCVPCNMGTYSEDGISHCKKCPPGMYQPNHGARVCRTCTDPLTKGCYNMLWSSFSAIMITLASLGVMLSIFLLFLWIICCAKKKFCAKQIASIITKEEFEQENPIEEQSLIKDVSENEDQQWDNECKAKKKKKKFYLNKKRRKQNERGKYEKTRVHEDEWGSHRIKNIPIVCPDSYRSHEDYNNYYSKQSYRKGPRLPECDFDT